MLIFPILSPSRAPFPSICLLGDRWICAYCWGGTQDSLHYTQPQLQLQCHLEIHHQVGQYEAFWSFLDCGGNHNFSSDFISSFCPQKVTVEERVRSSGENRLDIKSILTISAVGLADTGNISCIGTNEAGVNSSTTYLLVVGKPQRRSLLLYLMLNSLEYLTTTESKLFGLL